MLDKQGVGGSNPSGCIVSRLLMLTGGLFLLEDRNDMIKYSVTAIIPSDIIKWVSLRLQLLYKHNVIN